MLVYYTLIDSVVFCSAVKDDRVSYYSLKKAYSHELGEDGKHFTAFNMVHGPFGGVKGRDMLLVQSMDGKWTVLEQSAHAFTRQLADCLLPGPLLYLPRIDAFVTVNYAGQAECYRYQVLASSQQQATVGDAKGHNNSTNKSKAVRNSLVEWRTELGENCRQLLLGGFLVGTSTNSTSNSQEVLVLGEQSIFLLKAETGGLIQQRRFDRVMLSTGCIVPFSVDGMTGANLLVAGQDGAMSVLAGFNLVWAARLTTLTANKVPVQVCISSFGGTKGLVVAIDDSGYLSINYLGTKPPVTSLLSSVRDLDYDKIDEEHRSLLAVIREAQGDGGGRNNADGSGSSEKLLIKVQVMKTFDLEGSSNISRLLELPKGTLATFAGNNETYVKIVVRVYLTYTGPSPATNVSLTISAPTGVQVGVKNFVLDKVSGLRSTPTVVKVEFFALRSALPSSLEVILTASYTSHKGDGNHVVVQPFDLPLFLVVRPKAPTKSAACKIILDTEGNAALPLTELFVDVLKAFYSDSSKGLLDAGDAGELGGNAVQAMGFQLYAPVLQVSSVANANLQLGVAPLVSILVSKNAGRYRLQAESFPALYLLVLELERRLTSRLQQQNAEGSASSASAVASAGDGLQEILVRCNDVLPVDEFLSYVSQHLAMRHSLLAKMNALNDAAVQYRMIEKRLLVRFRDKNPTPLHGLDSLLTHTYNRILQLADEVENLQRGIQQLRREIESFAKLLALLAAMKFGLPVADRVALTAYFCPEAPEGTSGVGEQGWEEMMTAALAQLLRMQLSAKQMGIKDGSSNSTTTAALSSSAATLEMPATIETLRRNLMLVLERLEKGGRIVTASSTLLNRTASAATMSSGGVISTGRSSKK